MSTRPSATRPRVSVYVPCATYGRFLAQCLDSVARQSLGDWELLVIDDGSVDATAEVAARFAAAHPDRVRVHRHAQPQGLRACANFAIEQARGELVMRLDADDWLDESALEVLASWLDRHPQVGLVYPNWVWVDAAGEVLGVERRARPGVESQVADLPAHGACTMVRLRVLKAIGGYELDLPAQDGHELWLKTVHRFGVGHVETPLFFYRQHGHSLSSNESRLLSARREIKSRAASAARGPVGLRIAAVVPIKNDYPHAPNLALAPLAGRPLVDYTLDMVRDNPLFDAVVITTDDAAVSEHCRRRGNWHVHQRSSELCDSEVRLENVIRDAVTGLTAETGFDPDLLVVLSCHTPLRRRDQINEAVDTLLLYPVDQVISTWEIHDLYFRHGAEGMQAVNAGAVHALRNEREALFGCNGSIHVLWRQVLDAGGYLRGRIGHIVMTREESLLAKKSEERVVLESILQAHRLAGR